MRTVLTVAALVAALACCKKDEPPPPTYKPHEQPRFEPTPGPDANYWCFESPNDVERCDRTREACDSRRRNWLENWGPRDSPPEPCKPMDKAVCVTFKNTLDTTTKTDCYPSFTLCQNMRDNAMRGDRGDKTVAVDCVATE